MKTRYNERYENESTPSRDLVKKYREVIREEDHDVDLGVVSYRGGEVEFELGKEYCLSDDPDDRATGACVLAQLGWSDQIFREESIEILIPLLEDSDPFVVNCAAVALGHRAAETAIPALVRHSEDPSELVRSGVVFGLLTQVDPRAVECLIKMATDEEVDVRNWAVFGLGSQIEIDTPEIRQALRNALADKDDEVRGEGLVGLAERGDPNIVEYLLNEWRSGKVSILSLEAAELASDPRLYDSLLKFAKIFHPESESHVAKILVDATLACNPDSSNRA